MPSRIDEGKSCSALSSELGVGKTQILAVVKERDDIQRRWEIGERSDKKYVKPIGRQATMTWISMFGVVYYC